MTLIDLIKSNAWLSVKFTLEKLYPDQRMLMDDYETVYAELQTMTLAETNITIDVHWVHDDYDNTDYIDVSGYYINPEERVNTYTNSLSIEFTPWNEWLNMPIDNQSLKIFSELEIIAHCLFEMTFIGFDQDDIQAEMDNIKKIADDYDKMTPEERRKNTYTWEEVKERLSINFDENDLDHDQDDAENSDDKND